MRLRRSLLALLLLQLAVLPGFTKEPGAAQLPVYIHPEDYPIEEILPAPPPAGSELDKADHAKFNEVRAHRTPEEIARAQTTERDSVFLYADTLGKDFTAANLPKTAALFYQAAKAARSLARIPKLKYHRPRPDTPEGQEELAKEPGHTDFSFPSSHSMRAYLWATLLEQVFPEKSEALLKQAHQFGWNRVILGKHFPADVLAGQVLGEFIANELLLNADFQKAWAEARVELKTYAEKHT